MMAANPDVQRLAQEEIVRVLGARDPTPNATSTSVPIPARLPGFADRGDMPYLEAVFKEVMRTNPGLSMGECRSSG